VIHLLRERATPAQIGEMLEELKGYIKLAVDVDRGVLAGGGALHADCEAVLLEDGSRQEDVWGADWIPETQEIRFEALINIRPRQGNLSMTLEDLGVQGKIGQVAVRLLGDA
jgi:hypothetical protein